MFQTWLTMFKKQGWPCVDHGWTMVKHDSCRGILPPFWTWSTMNESLTMIIHVPKSHNDRGQTCLTMIPKTMVKHVLTKVVVYCRPWKHGQTCLTVCVCVPRPKPSQVMETVFHLKVTLTLTFDPLTSKSIGFICWSWPTSLPSLRSLGPFKPSQVINRKPFFSSKSHWPWPLTDWPQNQ